MEENKLEIAKPEFNGEIQARIKSVGEIESNMKEVKGYVEELNNYYKNITFTEETLKQAKEEKAKVNKFKTEVADYRKKITAEYNKPIKVFEDTAKETEKLLSETYNTINQQVAGFEEEQKRQKEQEIREYFEEYKTANDIDFVNYEQAQINVTLTASVKSLKEQAKAFIDRIMDDLKLIETQECKEEILVEYKQNLNVSKSIQEVANRHKLLEEEKKKQEELKNKQLEEAKRQADISIKEQELATKNALDNFVIEAPKVVEQEEILTLSFKVRGTRNKLKELKRFLIEGGYDYEEFSNK